MIVVHKNRSSRLGRLLSMQAVLMMLFGAVAPAFSATFTFTFSDNAEQDFAVRGWMDDSSPFQRNFRAAGKQWGVRIASNALFSVVVIADRSVPRFTGSGTNGRPVGTTSGGLRIWEPGALTRIQTGDNPGTVTLGGYDLRVKVNAAAVDTLYWIDNNPETRSDPVPIGKTDLVSIVMHELGHGLGFMSARSVAPDPTYGQFHRNYETLWDSLTHFGGDGTVLDPSGAPNPMFFDGPESILAYGSGPVPLRNMPLSHQRSPGNFSHLGRCIDEPPALLARLMGCFVPNDGSRMEITDLDLAVLADLGYPLNEIYYPSIGVLQFGVSAGGVMYGVRLHSHRADGFLELAGFSGSRRALSNVVYNATAGILTLPGVVAAEDGDPVLYSVDLLLVGIDPIRFAVTRVEIAGQ